MKRLFLAVGLAFLTGCHTGSVTVTGTPRPPIATTEVRVYAEPPAEYEVIALLESAPGGGWTQQSRHDDALEDLKEKAASLGANGILLTGAVDVGGSGAGVGAGSGHGGISIGFSQTKQSLLATAIYVQQED